MNRAPRKPGPEDLLIGARIRERRRALRLTQRQLASRVSMPPQLLQKYERGAIRLSAGRLRGLAAALGVPMGFFCGQSEGPVVSFERVAVRELDDLVPFLSSEEGLELNCAFRRISDPKIRRRIAALIDAISRT